MFLNDYCEAQLAASDGHNIVIYHRLRSGWLRDQVDDATKRGLVVCAVVLYNCATSFVYDWRATLENSKWLNRPLVMHRRPGEYRGCQHCLLLPARGQVYTIGQFEQLFLNGR